MKRGPKPKPTSLHRLHGTLNTTRHRERAQEPDAGGELDLEPPGFLTETQQAGWRYAIAHAPRGVLRQIDRALLVVWVEAEDRHRTACEVQARQNLNNPLPYIVKNRRGEAVPSPYVQIINRAAMVMMRAVEQLGFSPVARPRLVAPPADTGGADPWAAVDDELGGKPPAGHA